MAEVILSEAAPKPIGPYSQAIRSSGFVFCSGQIGLDPATGDLVSGGVQAETRRALENLRSVLEAAEAGLDRVVKTTVFLASMDDFAPMNEVYAEFFAAESPARTTVAVKSLPRGALVEIEAVAQT